MTFCSQCPAVPISLFVEKYLNFCFMLLRLWLVIGISVHDFDSFITVNHFIITNRFHTSANMAAFNHKLIAV